MTKKHLLPIEETAAYPLPGMAIPTQFTFSNDSSEIRFLASQTNEPAQKLYALQIQTGEKRELIEAPGGGVDESNLSPEEELQRQRQRMLATGITGYSTASQSERLLIPLAGKIYIWESGKDLALLVDTTGQAPALNASMTSDGKQVAYVQDGEIYTVETVSGASPRQITHDARGTGKTNGLAEFIAQEELGRMEGFWWSPDGEMLAYTQVDESHIPVYRIMHQGKDAVGSAAQEDHHYPFAGAENALVRLAVISAVGGDPVWMNTDMGEEVYLSRVFWWNKTTPGAEILNREQDSMWLVRFDLETGNPTIVLHETTQYWFTPSRSQFKILASGDFLMALERTGFNHIYLFDSGGNLIRQLTDGNWVVDQIIAVDEERGSVYFTGNLAHPTEQHLYQVSLNSGEIQQITKEVGTHTVIIDRKCQYFVDVFDSLETPPTITLRSLETKASIHPIHEPNDPRLEMYSFPAPEMVTLQNREGTTLYGAIYRPENAGEPPYPTIIYVYGGPGPQLVQNRWGLSVNMRVQYLRQQGYLVFTVDNRGSNRRGLEFEGAIKRRMGTIEVDDQVDGVHWLIEQGLADADRIGIFGWSYGGFMTLMCLAKAPDLFRVGVSGAPVTHYDGYDTAYTERYMSTPQANPDGYREGSILEHVARIKGKLLLIHGMLDENVHFRHTARLINALTRNRIPYDLLIFPDERHMPRHKEDRIYLNEHLLGYFEKHL